MLDVLTSTLVLETRRGGGSRTLVPEADVSRLWTLRDPYEGSLEQGVLGVEEEGVLPIVFSIATVCGFRVRSTRAGLSFHQETRKKINSSS